MKPTIVEGIRLHNVHDPEKCAGRPCVVHNPSDHHMRSWRLHWRGDRGIFERLCPDHGTGHPDPDQGDYWQETGTESNWVHGCCGDCVPPYPVINHVRAASVQPGYFVDVLGNVWSYWRNRGPRHHNESVIDLEHSPRLLKARPNSKGYLRVQLKGGPREQYVHRIVWDAFNDVKSSGKQVRHLDGDNRNNALKNLALGSQPENEQDKDRHKTRPVGENHSNSRLRSSDVVAIRNRFRSGERLAEIISSLGLKVRESTAHDAATGRTWKTVNHLSPPVPLARGGAPGGRGRVKNRRTNK